MIRRPGGGAARESEGRTGAALRWADADPGISGVRAAGTGARMPYKGAWELSVGDGVRAADGGAVWIHL